MKLTTPRRPRKPGTSGKGLESLILASPGAVLTKVPNGVRYLPGGRAIPCKGPCDFFGCLDMAGHSPRPVVLDAKQSGDARFEAGNRDHVPVHQRVELVRYGRAGAAAGLIVERTATRTLYFVPWRLLVNPPPSYPWDGLPVLGPSAMVIRWDRVARLSDAPATPEGAT